MDLSVPQWGLLAGVVAWDALLIYVIHRLIGRRSWARKVRPPKVVVKGRITRDWRPML